jgi:hypothetical protein
MPTGALIAARQALGQYLVYAPPWQRRLIGAGAVAGGAGLLMAGVITGHVMMAVLGGVLLFGVISGAVQAVRRRRGPGSSGDLGRPGDLN